MAEKHPNELTHAELAEWEAHAEAEWRKAGVWDALHRVLLGKLRKEDQIDFSRVVVDSSSIRAMHGGKKRDRAPWTAKKQGLSTIWRSMPMARRWLRRSPEPTAMT